MGRNDEVVRIPPSIVAKIHERRGHMSATARREGEERLARGGGPLGHLDCVQLSR